MLPPELLLIVAELLQQGGEAITNLSIVNRATHRTLLPMLYSEVALNDSETVNFFCQTIINKSPFRCHELVKKLQIGPSRLLLISHILLGSELDFIKIHRMLGALENLQELTISLPTPMLESLYRGLKCTFQLTRLICTCHPDEYFVAFLDSQPSITHLDLSQRGWEAEDPHAATGFVEHYNSLESRDLFLPCLSSIAGDCRSRSTLSWTPDLRG
ncbi:hypothetical protein FRC08_016322 [Ceratobasidium sp. 394]|nr:hypothetical protein FRC08_016322 [Ceratobasidium sp. 394]